MAGYPNLFFTFGPNSGPGHNSALVYMEAAIDYIVKAIKLLQQNDIGTLDVRRIVRTAITRNSAPPSTNDLEFGVQQLVFDRGRLQRHDVPRFRDPVYERTIPLGSS